MQRRSLSSTQLVSDEHSPSPCALQVGRFWMHCWTWTRFNYFIRPVKSHHSCALARLGLPRRAHANLQPRTWTPINISACQVPESSSNITKPWQTGTSLLLLPTDGTVVMDVTSEAGASCTSVNFAISRQFSTRYDYASCEEVDNQVYISVWIRTVFKCIMPHQGW